MATSWFFNFGYFPFTSYYGRHILILLFKLPQPPTLWFWLDENAVFICYDCVNAPTAARSSKPWLLSSPTQFFVFPGVNHCLSFFFFFPTCLVAEFSLLIQNALNYVNLFFTYSFASGTPLISPYWRSFPRGLWPAPACCIATIPILSPVPWFGFCHILNLTLPGFFSLALLSFLTKGTWRTRVCARVCKILETLHVENTFSLDRPSGWV